MKHNNSFIDKSSNINLQFLEIQQAEKELVINQNLQIIDGIMPNTLLSLTSVSRSKPSQPPVQSSLYYIPSNAQGEWAAHKNTLALYIGHWHYISLPKQAIAWVQDEQSIYVCKEGELTKLVSITDYKELIKAVKLLDESLSELNNRLNHLEDNYNNVKSYIEAAQSESNRVGHDER